MGSITATKHTSWPAGRRSRSRTFYLDDHPALAVDGTVQLLAARRIIQRDFSLAI